MPTPSRRKDSAVIEAVRENPFAYGFVQAVRLLERAVSQAQAEGAAIVYARNPVARHTPPATEAVRFHATQSLTFASSEIASLDPKPTGAGPWQWHLQVNFMGLTGSSGVLPYHYTELVLKRLKLKDRSLANFLDLFNHRLISLFYQASIKYRLPIEYERFSLGPAAASSHDSHTKILLALIGLGTPGLTRRLSTKDDALLYYAGLFTQKVRTVDGLKQILFHLFSIPVEVREFIGQWQGLIDDVRSRLPGQDCVRGQNNQLGKTAMLGRKGWFSQGKIRIVLGTLTQKQFNALAPGTPTLKALDEVVRLYIDYEHDYDYVMRIRRSDIPRPMRLDRAAPPKLAWDSWLSATGAPAGERDTVEIPVSARRFV